MKFWGILIVLLLATGSDLPVVPRASRDPALPIPTPSRPELGLEPRDIPRPVFFGEEPDILGDRIVYVIDRSGSMERWVSIEKGPRLEVAKDEVATSLASLDRSLRFNLVVFDCSIAIWAPSAAEATPDKVAEAVVWLESWRPGGGTGTSAAVITALQEATTVLLLTDGQPNCPNMGTEWHRKKIRAGNKGAKIHVFGIAADREYRGFCQAVAADSGGTYYDVR